jgi:hypothetical protein
MPSVCIPTLGICTIRAVQLLPSGQWVTGANAAVVSNGIISLSVTPEVEDGEQWRQRLPNGMYVAAAADLSQTEAFTYEMEFIQVEPALFQIMGGGSVVFDAHGNAVGVAISYRQQVPVYFALEMWSTSPAPDGGASGGVYSVEPFLYDAVFGAVEYQNEAISFHMTARSAQNPNWGNGPFQVVDDGGDLTTLPDPVLSQHLRYIRTTNVAPPDADCGFGGGGLWISPCPGMGSGSGGVSVSVSDEHIRDVTLAFLQAGSNITLAHNDGANTLTISSTGGGGGGGEDVLDGGSAGSTYVDTPIDGGSAGSTYSGAPIDGGSA